MCKLFLQVSGIDGLAVAVKIDRNSLIPSKWAAVARCQVCNGILQRSAVPTGARVHPNPITYPDSTHFPITGGGKSRAPSNWSLSLWDIQRVWLVEGGSVLGVVRVKLCMAGQKVWNQKCVLLLVLFHLAAQQVLERRKGKGTEDRHSTIPLSLPGDLGLRPLFPYGLFHLYYFILNSPHDASNLNSPHKTNKQYFSLDIQLSPLTEEVMLLQPSLKNIVHFQHSLVMGNTKEPF